MELNLLFAAFAVLLVTPIYGIIRHRVDAVVWGGLAAFNGLLAADLALTDLWPLFALGVAAFIGCVTYAFDAYRNPEVL